MYAVCEPGTAEHCERFVAAAQADGLSLTLSQLRGQLSQEGAVFAVATRNKQPIAWLLAQLQPEELEILDLVVLHSHRRRGVASCLLRFVATELAHRPKHIFVEVAADNPGARALYQLVGFLQVGVRKNYYARPNGAAATLGVDAQVLRWSPP